jgi:glycosyltransferase involved in cell wall biosynthesis
MKLGIISIALPPSQSGQSVVLFHLLKNVNADSYVLITQKNINMYHLQGNCNRKLSAKYYFLQPDNQITQRIIRGMVFLGLERFLDGFLTIRKNQIKKILTKELCDRAIACTGDLLDPPATFLACKELGIPFILYTFDYYSHQFAANPLLRSFAERYEKEMVTGARQIIVPNECMSEELHKIYGVHSTIIHNPFDLTEYENHATLHSGNEDRETKSGEIKIIYTGAVYDAHYSAFRNLIAAIPLTGKPDIKLHLFTPQSSHHLKENGIVGPVVLHRHLPNDKIPSAQRSADILFLPLAFNSPFPEIIKTAAPGKIGEYLASKRPILVHAPKDSFVSEYFKKYECGLVVDEDDAEVVAQALDRLITDEEFCRHITKNAYERAKTDFDIQNIQKKFHTVLGG